MLERVRETLAPYRAARADLLRCRDAGPVATAGIEDVGVLAAAGGRSPPQRPVASDRHRAASDAADRNIDAVAADQVQVAALDFS